MCFCWWQALTLLENKRQELMIANATLQAEAERSKMVSHARASTAVLSLVLRSGRVPFAYGSSVDELCAPAGIYLG